MTGKRTPVFVTFFALLAFIALAVGCASGSAKFQNKSPKFSMEYPGYYIAEPLKQDEVLRVKDPMGFPYFTVTVYPYQTGMDLNQVLNQYQKRIEDTGSGVKLMDIKRVELSGNLPGLQAELEWNLENGQKVQTLFLAVIKDKEVMVIAAHTQNGMKEAKKFVDTLKF